MNYPLVTIIVPIYNQIEYLDECLESVLCQTYSNYEVWMINDGSNDAETEKKCLQFCDKDKRFNYQYIDHTGVSAARNKGLEYAKGDYIIFLDNDDTLDTNRIECCINEILKVDQDSFSFVMCGINWIDDSLKTKKKAIRFDDREEVFNLQMTELAYVAWKRLLNFITNKMYRGDVIRDYNIRFCDGMGMAEDLYFNIDYIQKCQKNSLVVNKPLYNYIHRNSDRASLVYKENVLNDTKMAYRRLIGFATSDLGVNEDGIAVLKAIYLYNWTARLSALYNSEDEENIHKKELVDNEMQSEEFQKLLLSSWENRKISYIRYISLRTRKFVVYAFLRKIYFLVIR